MKLRILSALLLCTLVFGFTPSAVAADLAAPVLVDWTLDNSIVDISNGPTSVIVKFILSDDSNINDPKLIVKSLDNTQMSTFAKVKVVAKSGKLTSYEASTLINFGQSPREWEWVLYPLSDELGNTNNTFGPGGAWPTKFVVFDKSYTYQNFTFIRSCLSGLRIFNRALTRFLILQKSDPNNIQLSVLKLKFTLPGSAIDEKLCETDTARISEAYGPDQAVGLADALGTIEDEINSRTARAAAELKAKQEAEAKVVAATKKTTITCIKGKLTKKVTAINPKCPSGYKERK